MITQVQAEALRVVARKYHAGLLLQLAAGGAPQWVRTEAYRVGVLLDDIDKGAATLAPLPSGMRDRSGNTR